MPDHHVEETQRNYFEMSLACYTDDRENGRKGQYPSAQALRHEQHI